ncbi:hypothetical protein [Streptomyces sp. NPDC093097]|uniref:hypothetical protein n=1 Tax=Streptomyces sp. NPDC093097 TaxID=3366027 RepID=UPI0037FA8FA6
MSVLSAIHIRPLRPSAGPALRTVLREVVARIARGAADSPALHAVATPPVRRQAARRTPRRPRAHWHTVTDPDGRRRLEARWRPEA